MYITVDVIVDGALEAEYTALSKETLDEVVGEIMAASASDGLPTQVWAVIHNHDPLPDGEPCGCDMYLTRHAPYVTFNDPEHENITP